MRPVGREKSSFKIEKKTLPLRGIIIAVAAVAAAGWIFSLVTGRTNASAAAVAPGVFLVEDSADDIDSFDIWTEQQEAEKAALEARVNVAASVVNGSASAQTGTETASKTQASSGSSSQSKTGTGSSAQTKSSTGNTIRTIDLSPAEREATEKARREKKDTGDATYIGNARSMKFHYPSCYSVTLMNWKNVVFFYGGREELIEKHYVPCKLCHP